MGRTFPTEYLKQVRAKTFGLPVLAIPVATNFYPHAFYKLAVEQVERTFILIVVNVVAVRPKGPVNSLSPEFNSGILTPEKVNVPFAKCGP